MPGELSWRIEENPKIYPAHWMMQSHVVWLLRQNLIESPLVRFTARNHHFENKTTGEDFGNQITPQPEMQVKPITFYADLVYTFWFLFGSSVDRFGDRWRTNGFFRVRSANAEFIWHKLIRINSKLIWIRRRLCFWPWLPAPPDGFPQRVHPILINS